MADSEITYDGGITMGLEISRKTRWKAILELIGSNPSPQPIYKIGDGSWV
jgi:hypothetical protein